MWVMFWVLNWHGNLQDYDGTSAVPVTVISQEFSSHQACVSAMRQAKQSKKTYNVWCSKK